MNDKVAQGSQHRGKFDFALLVPHLQVQLGEPVLVIVIGLRATKLLVCLP